jgi:hypothetical protein
METLAKLLGRFFARDFLYFLGGANIFIAYLLVEFEPQTIWSAIIQAGKIPVVLFLPIAGLAYITGYIANYIFGLVRLNTPIDRLVPWDPTCSLRGAIVRALFRIFNGYPIEKLTTFVDEKVDVTQLKRNNISSAHVYALQAIDSANYLDRTYTIHHLSSVFGSTSVVCALILFYGYLKYGGLAFLVAAPIVLLLAILLCLDSHYRSAQIAIARIMIAKWRDPFQRDNAATFD